MKNTLTVKETASLLSVDVLSVRLMLQNGLVSWGQAVKLPGSNHYTYLIYRAKFEQQTGIKTDGR